MPLSSTPVAAVRGPADKTDHPRAADAAAAMGLQTGTEESSWWEPCSSWFPSSSHGGAHRPRPPAWRRRHPCRGRTGSVAGAVGAAGHVAIAAGRQRIVGSAPRIPKLSVSEPPDMVMNRSARSHRGSAACRSPTP